MNLSVSQHRAIFAAFVAHINLVFSSNAGPDAVPNLLCSPPGWTTQPMKIFAKFRTLLIILPFANHSWSEITSTSRIASIESSRRLANNPQSDASTLTTQSQQPKLRTQFHTHNSIHTNRYLERVGSLRVAQRDKSAISAIPDALPLSHAYLTRLLLVILRK